MPEDQIEIVSITAAAPTPPQPTEPSQTPRPSPTKPARRFSWTFAIIFALALLAGNQVVLWTSGEDVLQSAKTTVAKRLDETRASFQQWQVRRALVSVDADRFEALWREICPELLTPNGVPWEKAYADLLRQYDGKKIDEAFVRKLLEEMKTRAVAYDGNAYFRFDGAADAGKAPSNAIDPEPLKKEKVPVRFFLDNEEFYSTRIFEILTKQKDVRFAHEVKGDKYVFEAAHDMTQAEFFRAVSQKPAPDPKAAVHAGDRWNIPAEHVREISRVFEVVKSFTDHLGVKRTVTVYLDLSKYVNVHSEIVTLPDGTLLANADGPLQVREDALSVREIDGHVVKDETGTNYVLNGNVVFRMRNGACLYNAYGPCDQTEDASIWKETQSGKTVLDVTVNKGTTSLSQDGKKYRVIEGLSVKDANGAPVVDANDIGVKVARFLAQPNGKMLSRPNLDAYVDDGPFMRKLAHDIGAFYENADDKAQGMLDFVHSFAYKPGIVLENAKGPKEFLLSREGDCEDASVFAVSLWTSAGWDAAFANYRNVDPSQPGHAAPLLAKTACCSGVGITYANTTWLYAEATGKVAWKIGQDPGYAQQGLVAEIFYPHGKTPIRFK